MPPRSRGASNSLFNYLNPLSNTLRQPTRRPSPFICSSCTQHLRLYARSFTTTLPYHKKSSASKKSTRKTPEISSPSIDRHVPDNKATLNRDAEIDPYDYTELQSEIDKAITRLHDALTRTRDAGRVSAQMIENLPVEINIKGSSTHGGSAHKERTKIGDIASVVPKGGRSMQIFCAEEGHVKPITAAIMGSEYSLTPEAGNTESSNPLLIVVPVPPVTAETRGKAREEAKRVMERAAGEVRNARAEAQKKFRRMELGKLVIVDELRKAHKGMEEVVKKGQEEVKRVGEAAIKALDR